MARDSWQSPPCLAPAEEYALVEVGPGPEEVRVYLPNRDPWDRHRLPIPHVSRKLFSVRNVGQKAGMLLFMVECDKAGFFGWPKWS